MQNKDLIQQLAEAMYPLEDPADYLSEMQQQDAINLLTALHPFLPEWKRVEDELPEMNRAVMVVQKKPYPIAVVYLNEDKKFVDWSVDDPEHNPHYPHVVLWAYFPSTTHPYQLLLEELKKNNQQNNQSNE